MSTRIDDVHVAVAVNVHLDVKVNVSRGARVELSDGSKVEMAREGERRRYTWRDASPDARAIIRVMTGVRPLERA